MSQNDIRYLTPINIEIRKDKYCRFKKSGIKFIDYKDANFLLKLLNEQGKILPRRITGTSAKYQKKVDKLGYANEVVTVKPGYGRNFLIPQGYAILATASAKKAHAEIMKQKAHKESKMLAEAQELATKLEAVTVTIATKAGENGKIFGSVNTVQLSEALKKAGFDIDRKSLKIKEEPIKEVGTFEAEANLHKGVKPVFKFEVIGE